MTAAYMTRCIYLTFFGEYRGGATRECTTPARRRRRAGRAPPRRGAGRRRARLRRARRDDHGHAAAREQPPHHRAALDPLVLRGVRRLAQRARSTSRSSRSGSSRASRSSRCVHAEFNVGRGRHLGRDRAARHRASRTRYYWNGMGPQRLSPSATRWHARASTSSSSKYYLDVLYTDIIVGSHQGPDRATASYWFNQHVIDNVLNYAGRGARSARPFTYEYSTSAASTASSTASAIGTGEAGGAARAASRPVVCSSTHLILVCAVGLFASVAVDLRRKRRGSRLDELVRLVGD